MKLKTSKPVVNSLWIDPVMGEMQLMCLRSFLEKGMSFHLYTYNHIQHLPEGIVIKDANTILDKKEIFIDNKNSYATFSDWFRIKLLYKIGGWWVDCDTYCIRKFDLDLPYVFATERYWANNEMNTYICNAVIRMPSGTRLAENILTVVEKRLNTKKYDDIVWTELGAKVLADNIISENLMDYVVRPEVFCPIDYSNFKQLTDKEDISFEEITYGVHLWNKMWEWNKLNPMRVAKERSFIQKATGA